MIEGSNMVSTEIKRCIYIGIVPLCGCVEKNSETLGSKRVSVSIIQPLVSLFAKARNDSDYSL